ncbi:unnamed protein product [Hermetia illucens]|uniref:Uncharacterized protein n=1 Tax=Hermetia illucens TaxID=343691 RepID=A0A7R8Z0R6_HERIL|nr:unnamed protein product [Hermetia illucens]
MGTGIRKSNHQKAIGENYRVTSITPISEPASSEGQQRLRKQGSGSTFLQRIYFTSSVASIEQTTVYKLERLTQPPRASIQPDPPK